MIARLLAVIVLIGIALIALTFGALIIGIPIYLFIYMLGGVV